MTFLPDNYEVPQKSGSYMKFQDGINRFRILTSPIIGWVYWKTEADGSRKPIRKHMTDKLDSSDIEDEFAVKHFWAMPVYNYQEEKIQILEITQKSIQKAIKALASDKDWGSPTGYDLVVTKTGQKLETEYQLQPKPASPLNGAVLKLFEDMQINLNALYEEKDPFNSEKIELDDIPEDIK